MDNYQEVLDGIRALAGMVTPGSAQVSITFDAATLVELLKVSEMKKQTLLLERVCKHLERSENEEIRRALQ